ncbi:Uncharacterised protein [Clostridioides difficile]|nr:Uncharacterised protein [Clostridioides difficile]
MSILCGGWSDFKVVEKEDLEVFEEAVGTLKGISYRPIVVATQLVAGKNYCFICNATSVTNPPRNFLAEIVIFKPLDCKEDHTAVIKSINEIHNHVHNH